MIVAWANVIVAAAGGWLALFGLISGGLGALPFLLWALVQVVAGLGLLESRAWARRYLIYGAVLRLLLTLSSPAGTWTSNVFSLVATVVAIGTLQHLMRPSVRAAFPPSRRAAWLVLDAPAVALAALVFVRSGQPLPIAQSEPSAPLAAPRPAAAPEPRKPIAPGVGPATLVPTVDHVPVEDFFTAANVRLTLTAVEETPIQSARYNGTSVKTIGTIERRWHVHHGRIRIAAVPAGVYQVGLAIDRNGNDDHGDAGDLTASAARVELRTGHGPTRGDVPLQYVMTLREPRTATYSAAKPRAVPIGGSPPAEEIERLPQVASPVTFAWEPVPGAARYYLTVACEGTEKPLQATLREPSWTADLPPCPTPHPWLVYLSASGSSGFPIGLLVPRAFVLAGTPPSRATRGLRPAALTLHPTFDGRALDDVGERDVAIDLREPRHELEPSLPRVGVRVRHGRIKIPAFVPSDYLVTLIIGPDAADRSPFIPRPGDLVSNGYAQLRDVHTDWQPESRPLPLQRMMQLVEPDDAISSGWGRTHVRSPVLFRWEPVPNAVEYTVQVSRPKLALTDGTKIVVHEPSWRGELTSNAPDDWYFLEVRARSAKGADIALLKQHFVVDD